jgi:hypothetical protein
VEPKKPRHADPFAAAFLERLQDRPEASQFVLGGYFALKHYLDYRDTSDVDAWWRTRRDSDALEAARAAFAGAARQFGYSVHERSWGETISIEAFDDDRKVFSFQVATRSVEIEPPVASPWGRIPIETLNENMGAKMNALVARGAPRDFVDVKAVVDAGLVSVERCWELWLAKNVGRNLDEARLAVQNRLAGIVARMPLERLPAERRAEAETLRAWYRDVFTNRLPSGHGRHAREGEGGQP